MATMMHIALLFGLQSILQMIEANPDDPYCFDLAKQRTCRQLTAETTCLPVQDAASYITVTECSQHLSYNVKVEESIWEDYSSRFIVQLVCINQSSSEIVTEKAIAAFISTDQAKGKVCNFNYLDEPGIKCSLQGCEEPTSMQSSCTFKITSSANITCYEASTAVIHTTSTVSHYPSSTITSTMSSNSVSHSNSYYSVTSSRIRSTNSTFSTTSNETPAENNIMSPTNNGLSASTASDKIPTSIVILVAVVVLILFIGIVCALVMSGAILCGNFSKAKTQLHWNQERQIKDTNVRHNVITDVKFADVYSIGSATTIFEELCINADNNETFDPSANTSTAKAETPSCKSSVHHLPSQLKSLTQNNEENSIASAINTESSQNIATNITATHPSTEYGDVSIVTQEVGGYVSVTLEEVVSVTLEEVNCEWDRTRPRSTDLTPNYQQCSDGYRVGSISSCYSVEECYIPNQLQVLRR